MGVDIRFFVETNRHGAWECEAEFFLPPMLPLFAQMSVDGMRGFNGGDIAQDGFPEDVSDKVLFTWGTSNRADTMYPDDSFDTRYFYQTRRNVTVFRYFGNFGECHINTQEFRAILGTFLMEYGEEWTIPAEYTASYSYMKHLDSHDVNVRAVYWFDN